jgi:hypothetical protein
MKKRTTALRLIARWQDLEGKVQESMTFDLTVKRLHGLDDKVRKQHSKLVDLIDEGEKRFSRQSKMCLISTMMNCPY